MSFHYRWQYEDDILVCFLAMYEDGYGQVTRESVAEYLSNKAGKDMSGSLAMRIGNCQGTLGNIAAMTARACRECESKDQATHYQECVDILRQG